MVADVLVDTGVILVLLDKNERWHPYCQNAFRQIRVQLLTPEAVLTEVFQLLHRSRTEMESVWTLLESGVIALAAIGHSDLPKIRGLMSRYKVADGFRGWDARVFSRVGIHFRNIHARPEGLFGLSHRPFPPLSHSSGGAALTPGVLSSAYG